MFILILCFVFTKNTKQSTYSRTEGVGMREQELSSIFWWPKKCLRALKNVEM